MGLPSEDDRYAIDRAFAELVAGYHLTADPPDPFANEPPTEPVTAPSVPDAADGGGNWASDHPLFGFPQPPAAPQTPSEKPPRAPNPRGPLPPLRRPAVPALLGWIGIGYAIVIVLAA